MNVDIIIVRLDLNIYGDILLGIYLQTQPSRARHKHAKLYMSRYQTNI